MFSLIIVWVFVILLFIFDKQFYKTLVKGFTDKTLYFLIFSLITVLIIASVENYYNDSNSYYWFPVILTGYIIRFWAKFSLGKQFDYEVKLQKQHELVTTGIYSVLRHPMYTGYLLVWLGSVMMLSSFYGFLALITLVFPAFIIRIRVEEKLLLKHFKLKYKNYSCNTWRIIPFIY